MRFSIDSNILIYAIDRDAGPRHDLAANILIRAPMYDAVIAAQVLGEVCNVVRRKMPVSLNDALDQVTRWTTLFPIAATLPQHIIDGAKLAIEHKLQFWDCVILSVARSAGAGLLLSEDLQDGGTFGGVAILNPFNPANAGRLAAILD